MGVLSGIVEGGMAAGGGGGTGDVAGPASSTDNALVRFDSTTGKLIQDGTVTESDAGVLSGCTQLNVDNLRLDGNTLSSTSANGNVIVTPNGSGIVRCSSGVYLKSPVNSYTSGDDPVDLTSLLSGGISTNTGSGGSITFILPSTPVVGDTFPFAVNAAQAVVVAASGSQVIKVGAAASTAGGNFSSSTSGSFLQITYIATDLWVGFLSGVWLAA